MFAEGRPYIITNQISSLVLGLSGLDNTFIVAREPDGSNGQKWIPTSVEDGTWTFKSVVTGKFLSVEGEPRVGARAIGADSPTFWRIYPGVEGPGSYWILTKDSLLAVSFPGDGHVPPGAHVILQDGTRQAWKFVVAEAF